MLVIFKIEMTEIEQVKELTYYNHVMWKMKNPTKYPFTHFQENYHGCCGDCPMFTFYSIEGDKKVVYATGEGDGIDEAKVGVGGVYIEVDINYPELLLK